jgi:hypothetical protein
MRSTFRYILIDFVFMGIIEAVSSGFFHFSSVVQGSFENLEKVRASGVKVRIYLGL